MSSCGESKAGGFQSKVELRSLSREWSTWLRLTHTWLQLTHTWLRLTAWTHGYG